MSVRAVGSQRDEPAAPQPADSVDALLASWRHRRADLDFSPVAIATRLSRVRSHLDGALERLFAAHGLSGAHFALLVTLARIDDPRGVGQRRLMDELGLTSGTLSVRMDRLVELGLVSRRPDPELRRNTLVMLTGRGRDLFERVAPAHLENERRLLAGLTAEEQETLTGLLRKLLVEFEGSTPADPDLPRLGLTVAPAHAAIALRQSVGLPAVAALLVRVVDEGGAADLAGVHIGDLLLSAGRHRLRSITGLYAALAEAAPEMRLHLSLLRGTEEEQVFVALTDAPPAPAAAPPVRMGEHTI